MSPVRFAIHCFIYFVLGTGWLSALYMVFIVYKKPEGTVGPLFGAARKLPHEFLVQRRLYALEAWITFGALAVYFALTDYKHG